MIDNEVCLLITAVHNVLASGEIQMEERELFSDLLSPSAQTQKRKVEHPSSYHTKTIVKLTKRLMKANNMAREQFHLKPERVPGCFHFHSCFIEHLEEN